MYGIYGDIIDAAERALEKYGEIKELLEYPEVMADKAYYLSVLKQYNALENVHGKLMQLKNTLKEEEEIFSLIAEAGSESERAEIYREISSLKRIAAGISADLSAALGCKGAIERALCRFKLQQCSSAFGVALFGLIKSYLLSRAAKIEDEKISFAKGGYVDGISFCAEGEDVITKLSYLTGAHKVYVSGAKSEELCFAVTPAATVEVIDESDLKIDVFHSHGAGGQNINKVETAVRITHIPTGISVVCQDERSQLKNKKRALETIEKRLKERGEQAEKARIEADISAQYRKKHTPLSFDAAHSTLTDTRLKAFSEIPFPVSEEEFASYINGLIAL